jgi:hypothetical protein
MFDGITLAVRAQSHYRYRANRPNEPIAAPLWIVPEDAGASGVTLHSAQMTFLFAR